MKKDCKPKYFNSLALRANIVDYQSKGISLYFGSNFHFVIYPVSQNNEFNFISVIKKELLDINTYTDQDFLQSTAEELYKKTKIDLNGKLTNIKSFPVYVSDKIEISENKNIYF